LVILLAMRTSRLVGTGSHTFSVSHCPLWSICNDAGRRDRNGRGLVDARKSALPVRKQGLRLEVDTTPQTRTELDCWTLLLLLLRTRQKCWALAGVPEPKRGDDVNSTVTWRVRSGLALEPTFWLFRCQLASPEKVVF